MPISQNIVQALKTWRECFGRCDIWNKPINIHTLGTIHAIPTPEPFSRWGIDHTGPVFHNGVKTEPTVIEYATSIATAQLTQAPTATSAVKLATHMWVLDQSLFIYNSKPSVAGYSLFFLAFGVTSTDFSQQPVYEREPTEKEEINHSTFLVRSSVQNRSQTRNQVSSGNISRDTLRAYLQVNKAGLRIFGKEDRVIHQRARQHKGELTMTVLMS
ncbi:hypothetical protein HI914_01378 [Erysiphe necator]|nr:hypothetical protein HI914_01378 [Erysiphe necator]